MDSTLERLHTLGHRRGNTYSLISFMDVRANSQVKGQRSQKAFLELSYYVNLFT